MANQATKLPPAPMTGQRRANIRALEELGVVRGADGRFTGSVPPTPDPDAPPPVVGDLQQRPEAMEVIQQGNPFFREDPPTGLEDMGGDDEPFQELEGDGGEESQLDAPLGPPDPELAGQGAEGQGHDWAKREADAKAEQRRLSKQQQRLKKMEEDLRKQEQNVNGRLAELDVQAAAIAELMSKFDGSKAIPVDLSSVPEIAEYRANYPGLIKVIEAYTAPMGSISSRLDAIEGYMQSMLQGTLQTKATAVISSVEQVYPKAKETVKSQDFVDWVKAQPAGIRAQIVNIVDHTAQHTVEDALWVLDQYHAAKGQPRATGAGAAPAARRTPGDSLPATRGGSGGPGPSGPQLTPLTPQEIANYSALVNEAARRGPAALAFLKQRRELAFKRRF